MTRVKLKPKEGAKRQTLQERLSEKIAQLKVNSKDAHFTAQIVDEILSLKGQIDIVPTEVEVRCKDVIKNYDFDTFTFKVCNNGILFQTKGGVSTLVEPRCLSLYGSLLDLLTQYDHYSEKNDEDKEMFDQYLSAWTHTLQMPVGASLSPVVLFATAATYLKTFIEESENLLNQQAPDETPEDHIKNAEGEVLSEILDSMSEASSIGLKE